VGSQLALGSRLAAADECAPLRLPIPAGLFRKRAAERARSQEEITAACLAIRE